MKKVIVSAYACSPIRGSEPGNGWNWALHLAKAGYAVWCITNTEDREHIEKAQKESGLENLHFVFVPIQAFLDKKLLDTSSKKIYLHYMLWRRKASRVAIDLHKEIRFDIAHHVTFGSIQQGTFLWKLKGARLIFGPVGGGQQAFASFRAYFGNEWRTEVIRGYLSRMLVKWNKNCYMALRKAYAVLVSNKDTYELARKNGATHPVMFFDATLPANFFPETPVQRDPGKTVKLLWTGRFLPRKALPLLLEAFSKVDPSLQYSLTIVGDGPLHDQVIGSIRQNGLEEKITLTGWIPFEQVKAYYKSHDIFIFTSLRESGGVQLLEAMAYSMPVITLDIHGASVLVPDNAGIKVPVHTPAQTTDDLAEAIRALVLDSDKRNEMSAAAYQFARSQNWDNKVSEVTRLFYES